MTARISAEELRKVLDYDPVTGIFHWKIKIAKKISIGSQAGCLGSDGYIRIRIYGVLYLAQRLAWLHYYGYLPKMVDHRNTRRGNNWISNLRPTDKSKNATNSRKHRDNSSGYKGVHWNSSRGKWYATICKNYKAIFLGAFDDKLKAAAAYAKASEIYHGEHGRV